MRELEIVGVRGGGLEAIGIWEVSTFEGLGAGAEERAQIAFALARERLLHPRVRAELRHPLPHRGALDEEHLEDHHVAARELVEELHRRGRLLDAVGARLDAIGLAGEAPEDPEGLPFRQHAVGRELVRDRFQVASRMHRELVGLRGQRERRLAVEKHPPGRDRAEQDEDEKRLPDGRYLWRRNTSVPLVPPKPNEFDTAPSIFISRAWLGT